MDILFLCVYVFICGIVIYWKIVRPWNASRHQFLQISISHTKLFQRTGMSEQMGSRRAMISSPRRHQATKK